MKSVKKAITVAVGESLMTFSEMQTVCYEAANLVNERPIGRHPTLPEDGTYLCPNDPALGFLVVPLERRETQITALSSFSRL